MKKNQVLLIGLGLFAILMLLPGTGFSAQSMLAAAENLIISFEGFSSKPYWDKKRYSWGYGTAAPGPSGVISEQQARADLQQFVVNDYEYLRPLITRPLSLNQWSALLSFSYNEGKYNADNLLPEINSGDDAALEVRWKKYIYADGVVNDTLVERRAIEWQVWSA